MKIKYKYYMLFALVIGQLLMYSCDDDFLQEVPSTKITEENYFGNIDDLNTYVNGLYGNVGYDYNDLGTDNIAHHNSGGEMEKLLRGDINHTNIGGWSWSGLRKINFFMENYTKVKAEAADVNHYVGIVRFFRAWFYFNKVKKYGDVPWYDTVLTTKSEDLYKGRDPRTLVMDKIFEDLDFAVKNIKTGGHKTKINKWVAHALRMRIALFEGSYRKYHTYLGLNNSVDFFNKAVESAQAIIGSGNYSIPSGSDDGSVYKTLFSSFDLSSNSDVILFLDFDKDKRKNNLHTVLDYEYSLSRNFVDTYLMKDGTPFTSVSGNATKTLNQIFENRDPRIKVTVMQPGFTSPDESAPHRLKPTLGGYNQLKFYPTTEDQISWNKAYTDIPVFRYAEVLISLAEAKAELGSITQGDVDATINKVRARIAMAPLNLTTANSTPDPVLVSRYSNVSGANKGVLLEIRRERRVEFACEGFRYDDIKRWKAGKLLETKYQGMYYPALGAMDVTGDGVPDIAILESAGKTEPLAGLSDAVKAALSLFYLKDSDGNPTSIYLENGTSGRIMFTTDKASPKVFKDPQYYYRPLPREQVQLNENLKQLFGW